MSQLCHSPKAQLLVKAGIQAQFLLNSVPASQGCRQVRTYPQPQPLRLPSTGLPSLKLPSALLHSGWPSHSPPDAPQGSLLRLLALSPTLKLPSIPLLSQTGQRWRADTGTSISLHITPCGHWPTADVHQSLDESWVNSQPASA